MEGPGLEFTCQCPSGWQGQRCEEERNECESSPCQNGAVCVDKLDSYSCACPMSKCTRYNIYSIAAHPHKRTLCRKKKDNKEHASPLPRPHCIAAMEMKLFLMLLPTHSTEFTGTNCEEPVLECDDSPCHNDALCLMEEGLPVCYCVPDFHGEHCEDQYDECQLGPR